MANDSKIQWTDHTVNFWTGCKKVSDGCKFCYMYRGKEMYGKDPTIVIKTSEKTVRKHLSNAKAGDKVFVCSWSDFFIEEADQWRADAWKQIWARPDLTFQILTKRPERIAECLPADWGTDYNHVWLGVTIEDQKSLIKRVPIFNKINANVKFISFEPLLGPIDLFAPELRYQTWDITYTDLGDGGVVKDACMEWLIDWAIIGGESGNNVGKYQFRSCDSEWIIDLTSQLDDNGTPVFVKQLGTFLSKKFGLKDRHGGIIEEWPESIRSIKQRNFPILN